MWVRTLSAIADNAILVNQVLKSDLQMGDWLIVTTLNSTYSIRVLGDYAYLVQGGWFDRNGLSPIKTTITGCTWGGSAVKVDVAAACNLHLEFGNRVVTSPIQKVRVLRFNPTETVQ